MNARKTLVSLLSAGALAVAASAALAHGPGYGWGGGAMMGGSPEVVTQRLGDLKGALKLTAQQESAWSSYEQAVTRAAAGRAKLFESMQGARGQPDALGDLRVSMMKFNAQSADEINQARKALVATLTPEQKTSFDQFRPGPGPYAGRGPGYGPGHGPGYGPRSGACPMWGQPT